MSDTSASLRRKIGGAGDLQTVVRTMKAVAASSIGQYEQSVRALGEYYHAVEFGLGECFREGGPTPTPTASVFELRDGTRPDREPVEPALKVVRECLGRGISPL